VISSLLAGRLLGPQIQRALGRGRRRWSSQLVIACEFVWNATQLTVVKSTFLAECSQNQVTAQLLGFCTDRADFQKKAVCGFGVRTIRKRQGLVLPRALAKMVAKMTWKALLNWRY
jgi:hypothetical protein